MVALSKHAQQRLSGRFNGILTPDVVCQVVKMVGQRIGFGVGETAIRVKQFAKPVVLRDCDGSESWGDVLYIVYRRSSASDAGTVSTIELRLSSQSFPARWNTIVNLV